MDLQEIVHQINWLGGQYAMSRAGLPSEWNQDDWIQEATGEGAPLCGTKACLAGNIAIHQGFRPLSYNELWGGNDPTATYPTDSWVPVDAEPDQVDPDFPWPQARTASDIASEVFDNNTYTHDGTYLFWGENDFGTLIEGLSEKAREAAKQPQNHKLARALGLLTD